VRNFLSLADAPGAELDALLEHAARIARDGPDPAALRGKRVALLFLNPSLRTRTSMELAAKTQGAHSVTLVPGADAWKVELERGAVMDGDAAEHLVDAIRVLSRMADVIGVRTFAGLRDVEEDRQDRVLALIARESTVPVVNMESAFDHPLQALADLQTLQEEVGDLRGEPVALTWAPHPRALPMAVAAAFLRGAARAGMDVRVAAPDGFELPGELIDDARRLLPGSGGITTTNDQHAAARGARAVYAKAWAAPALYGDPDAGLAARNRNADWTVSEELLAAGDDAVFLHCLPVRRNVVVTDGVLDGPRCAVYRQAENRYHTACAVLSHVLGGA